MKPVNEMELNCMKKITCTVKKKTCSITDLFKNEQLSQEKRIIRIKQHGGAVVSTVAS